MSLPCLKSQTHFQIQTRKCVCDLYRPKKKYKKKLERHNILRGMFGTKTYVKLKFTKCCLIVLKKINVGFLNSRRKNKQTYLVLLDYLNNLFVRHEMKEGLNSSTKSPLPLLIPSQGLEILCLVEVRP